MKTFSVFLLTLFFAWTIHAQCYSVSQLTYNHDSLTNPTAMTSADDQYSGPIPIGFPFCFYGASYDSLIIGANSIISFDTQLASGYCQWPIGAAIPSASNPVNTIFFSWQDLYAPAGGTVSYQTIGSSPNRKFVVDFDSVPFYSCTGMLFTGEVKLFETTNVIEMDIAQKQVCQPWNGGNAIEGIQNSLGTSAVVVPGRNYPTQWTATNDAWSFTPTCNVCSGVGIAESQNLELNLFVSENNQITIISNGNFYKVLGVYDMLGQQVKFSQIENTISFAEASPGIYIVNLEINGVHVAKKVMLN